MKLDNKGLQQLEKLINHDTSGARGGYSIRKVQRSIACDYLIYLSNYSILHSVHGGLPHLSDLNCRTVLWSVPTFFSLVQDILYYFLLFSTSSVLISTAKLPSFSNILVTTILILLGLLYY